MDRQGNILKFLKSCLPVDDDLTATAVLILCCKTNTLLKSLEDSQNKIPYLSRTSEYKQSKTVWMFTN